MILKRHINNNAGENSKSYQANSGSVDNSNLNCSNLTHDMQYYKTTQLQLIVSKCRCEFYIIDFDDKIPTSNEQHNLANYSFEKQQQQLHEFSRLKSLSALNLSNSYCFTNLFQSTANQETGLPQSSFKVKI